MTPSPKFQGPLIPVVCRSNRSKNMGQFVKCFFSLHFLHFLHLFFRYSLRRECIAGLISASCSRAPPRRNLGDSISEASSSDQFVLQHIATFVEILYLFWTIFIFRIFRIILSYVVKLGMTFALQGLKDRMLLHLDDAAGSLNTQFRRSGRTNESKHRDALTCRKSADSVLYQLDLT